MSFLDAAGAPILEEKEGGRTVMPAVVMGENTQHVRQEWVPHADEALYGLGENQLGLLNLKGYDLDLWQHNGTLVVPFLVSSRGWGILWDNTSFTRFGDLRELDAHPGRAPLSTPTASAAASPGQYYSGADFKHLVGERVDRVIDIALSSKEKKPNSLIYAGLPEGNASVRWVGAVEPEVTGDYHVPDLLEQRHQAVDRRSAGHRPLAAGLAALEGRGQGAPGGGSAATSSGSSGARTRAWRRCSSSGRPRLRDDSATPSTSLWSEVGDGIDYSFVYGPELDKVVAGYRRDHRGRRR